MTDTCFEAVGNIMVLEKFQQVQDRHFSKGTRNTESFAKTGKIEMM